MTDTATTDSVSLKNVMLETPQQDLSQSIVYTIENLTIHNHGTLKLLYDGQLKLQSQPLTLVSNPDASDPTSQWTRRESEIRFENRFPVPIKNVWIWHQYGDEDPEEQTWHDLGAGERTRDSLTATFYTGFNAWRSDKWAIRFTMPDGTVFQSREKLCLLRDVDEITQGPLIFYINDNFEFQINTRGGGDKTALWEKDDGFNTMAFVQVKNNFEKHKIAQIGLTHTHSDEPAFQLDFGDLEPNQESVVLPIYFLSGVTHSGIDKWNIRMKLPGLVLPVNAVTKNRAFTNKSKDHAWIVWERRVMKTMVFSIERRGVVFPETTNEIMTWSTPLGYSKCCLAVIQNDFDQDIENLTLIHQCHDERRHEYVYPPISKGKISNEARMMEYSTGISNALINKWTIRVTLKDGTQWSNTSGMNYIPQPEESTLIFSVNKDRLRIGSNGGGGDGTLERQSVICQVELFESFDSDEDWTDTQSIVSVDDD